MSPILSEKTRRILPTRSDKSLRDLVERILPLGTYYTSISSFIELRSHLDLGLVNHALCAAVRDMLKDYQTLLSQLEHAFNTSPTFSLQKLWFYVHPTVHTLSLIYNLVLELASYSAPSGSSSDLDSDESQSPSTSDAEEDARNEALGLGGAKLRALQSEFETGGKKSRRKGATADDDETSEIPVKGGEVLAVIYERMQHQSGDPTAREVYGTLLRKAGKPYVEMVRGWVGQGRLVDPYDEFLVKERRDVDIRILESDYVDEYWEGRYTVRCSASPMKDQRIDAFFIAERWVNPLIKERTSSRCPASQKSGREVTRRSLCTSTSGGLETQDLARWKIP